jgi:hypothetical protein
MPLSPKEKGKRQRAKGLAEQLFAFFLLPFSLCGCPRARSQSAGTTGCRGGTRGEQVDGGSETMERLLERAGPG